ncbi:class I SAM-dependent methyltransferase [Nocardia bovistercoris]|uniref:Class I SAM-dependent methyltransferase n=1 Tax=Nocardia bovistercoris TaxID=2785916 RepID=A0A931IEY4_9NOCA|nr:class I SAM-dependent methyltransferase [Nocardia bovistercoris]MBH0779308.1 class I SAM-dependent methyltransferase [Nocardia bovistercoris]
MPTPRAEPPNPLPTESHRARNIAESFGVDAARYDRSRPRYPDALIREILDASPGRDVLDVGIGTGIVARQFRAAGASVHGVEPDARMAEFARGGGFPVDTATFEKWEPRERRFDAVVAGQTWHWVDPDRGAEQAARILRPHGRLAVFWNVQTPPEPLRAEFADVYLRVLPDSPLARMAANSAGPQTHSQQVDKASDGIRRTNAFERPQFWEFDWEQRYSRAQWLDFAATSGIATNLPESVLAEVLSGLGAAIDRAGGHFTCAYRTVAVTAARL